MEVDLERTMIYNSKISFNGITGYQNWIGNKREMKAKSLVNLLNMEQFIHMESLTEEEKKYMEEIKQQEREFRRMSAAQARKLKKTAGKLAYYSATRTFTNKRNNKKHSFKVAFLTLTAPEQTTPQQFLEAFENFLSYLRRTANCVYVWKKEIGKKGGKLHVHILINNFIPYYIVSWKWKRLLMSEGVKWPITTEGKHTNSHYSIEIPRSKRQIASYIAKYMSKEESLPAGFGYIWGFSNILKDCEEIVLEEGNYSYQEVNYLKKLYKVIEHDFFTHICCDPARIKKIAPGLYSAFSERALEISYMVSLPQKFQFLDSS